MVGKRQRIPTKDEEEIGLPVLGFSAVILAAMRWSWTTWRAAS